MYNQLMGRVRHMHLSSYDGREHRLPHQGSLGLERLLARMAADAYPHLVTLELSPEALKAGSDDARVLELLSASLSQCRSWAAS